MKTGRAEFLRSLISKLDESGLSWCCLRNAEQIFKDNRSDVDLLVLPEDIPLFESLLDNVCHESGARLAQDAVYLNFSRTYLTPAGEWIRIDYEGEVRWKVFPVLSARKMLLRRVRQDGVWVASPADEAVVLWIAALFRLSLSDRYRARLRELDPILRENAEAHQPYREAWGFWGARLLDQQPALLTQDSLSPLWREMGFVLTLRSLLNPFCVFRCLHFLSYDVRRVINRLFEPKGFYLAIESSKWSQADSLEIIWQFDRVFPVSKTYCLEKGNAHSDWQQKRNVQKALFKGGLVLHLVDPGAPISIPKRARALHIRQISDESWVAGGQPSGWMTEQRGAADARACYRAALEFLTIPRPRKPHSRGLFCVLLGLDGSGKTTLARNLAHRFPRVSSISRFRYFHFLPPLFGAAPFPWPCEAAEPKKRESSPGWGARLGSAVRLARNIFRAHVRLNAWVTHAGDLLLGDRYLYNYILDPASVRYCGSSRFAAWALRRAPRPDLLFVLETAPETILQRKQELSPDEIRAQNEILRRFPFVAGRVIRLAGSRPPEDLADECLREIRLILEKNTPGPISGRK